MEQLALSAVTLLVPYLAKAGESIANEAGGAAVAATKALYVAIRSRFHSDDDPYAQQTLERLEEKPDAAGRQSALASVLAEHAEEDSAFADELKRLVEEVTGGRPVDQQFLVQVYGGEVGKIVQIGHAGTVTF
jgi:hypothetical protein